MKRFLTILCLVVGLALIVFFTWKIGQNRGYHKGFDDGVESVVRDTTTIIDTMIIEKPIEVVKWKDKERLVYVPVHDTTTIHDSTYIVLPRENKLYKAEEYECQVSGIDPLLDWIKVYQKTETITQYVPTLPEVTVTPAVKLYATPAGVDAAAMLRVTKWWEGGWRFDGGVGYGYHFGPELSHGWYVEIGFGFDVIRK